MKKSYVFSIFSTMFSLNIPEIMWYHWSEDGLANILTIIFLLKLCLQWVLLFKVSESWLVEL